ncbi:unnamed protein product [Parnassius apollo]|uniref:(apollo) hypothetical protein n=1 Tax=Parnassius apollo TaxID=110799 RepID=A0A8S3WZ78_PARAO|nr:unnamed protein product [Parnassius apollo]
MVIDIVENDKPISDNSQGAIFNVSGTLPQPINSRINIGENAGKSVMVKISEKEIMPCSFKLDTRDSDTSRQSSYEQVLFELKGNQEKTRRHVGVRGDKFGSSCISKENISNIKTTLILDIETSSEDEKPLITQERPCKRVKTLGGKSCSASTSNRKTSITLISDIETSSEDEKPPITQERPCKRVRTRGGKSCSASTSNRKTTSIEEELTDIIGTTSEHENLSKRSENENLPISDEQLLQILEDPDENYDDDIFDPDFIENMNHSDNDSDTSIVSEDELVPRNTEEDQEWSNHYRQTRRINFEGNPVGLKIEPEGSEPIDYFNLVVTNECLQMIVEKSSENASRILAQNFPGIHADRFYDKKVVFVGSDLRYANYIKKTDIAAADKGPNYDGKSYKKRRNGKLVLKNICL